MHPNLRTPTVNDGFAQNARNKFAMDKRRYSSDEEATIHLIQATGLNEVNPE